MAIPPSCNKFVKEKVILKNDISHISIVQYRKILVCALLVLKYEKCIGHCNNSNIEVIENYKMINFGRKLPNKLQKSCKNDWTLNHAEVAIFVLC